MTGLLGISFVKLPRTGQEDVMSNTWMAFETRMLDGIYGDSDSNTDK